jgi:hypothetical protein
MILHLHFGNFVCGFEEHSFTNIPGVSELVRIQINFGSALEVHSG